jgi:hypothetical protein
MTWPVMGRQQLIWIYAVEYFKNDLYLEDLSDSGCPSLTICFTTAATSLSHLTPQHAALAFVATSWGQSGAFQDYEQCLTSILQKLRHVCYRHR